jgi:molecular chaperone DnaK (HSP70)
MKRVRNVIRDSGLSTYDINDIFLVGGSTRIPMIQKLVRDSFRGKEPVKWIDPHEAVARGAAIQAAVLSDEKDNHPGTVIILEANSFTLGIDTINGEMKALIRRNARLPAVKSTSLTTYKDKQEQIKIQMFQGEKKFATANHWLGSFDLLGIRAAPSGVPRINVTFVIDTNGAVSVSAVDQSTKANEEVPIAAHRPRLSEDQLGKAIARARAMKKDDEKSS